MRIAVFSDVHGNLTALEAVIKDMAQRDLEGAVHLGDLVGYGPRPNEVVARMRAQLADLSATDVLRWAARTFGKTAALATSLGAEDQVLTDLIARVAPQLSIFTLDTGRLFPESYDLIAETTKRYDVSIDIFFPEASAVETLVNEHGANLFRDSVELRKACCRVRKLEPLARALSTKQAWITGLRREQSPTRTDLSVIEFDAAHGIYKINPLLAWSEQEVMQRAAARALLGMIPISARLPLNLTPHHQRGDGIDRRITPPPGE